jgi:hypothetical protein
LKQLQKENNTIILRHFYGIRFLGLAASQGSPTLLACHNNITQHRLLQKKLPWLFYKPLADDDIGFTHNSFQ